MKNLLRTGFLIAGLMVAPFAAYAAAETYSLDPAHTSVVWSINHFGFSNPWGKFSMITGSLTLDEQKPQASQITVTIPMSGLMTGIPKLDEHLASDQFFNSAAFPNATFVSTKVTQTSPTAATVEGNLTVHGVTHAETLAVTLNKIGENMMKKKTAGFSATATIKRSDFGMTTYLPMLGDEVKLYIESEANLGAQGQ